MVVPALKCYEYGRVEVLSVITSLLDRHGWFVNKRDSKLHKAGMLGSQGKYQSTSGLMLQKLLETETRQGEWSRHPTLEGLNRTRMNWAEVSN